MLSAGSLIATLDPTYYLNPNLLWNAPNYGACPRSPIAGVASQLTITPAANFAGTFLAVAGTHFERWAPSAAPACNPLP